MPRPGLVALCLALGCGPDWGSFLDGREFRSESVEGRTLVPGTLVMMRFFGDGFWAYAGCNLVSSNGHRLVEGVLEISDTLITQAGCYSEEQFAQDDWLKSFVEGSPAYQFEEPRLTLSDDIVTLVLLDEALANPDRPLQGTLWTAEGLIDHGSVGFWGTELEQPPTLRFADDGTVAIQTPCAAGAGTFALQDSLVLDDVAIADEACPDEDLLRIHAHMLQVLADGMLVVDIEGTRLTLTCGDIGLWLTTD